MPGGRTPTADCQPHGGLATAHTPSNVSAIGRVQERCCGCGSGNVWSICRTLCPLPRSWDALCSRLMDSASLAGRWRTVGLRAMRAAQSLISTPVIYQRRPLTRISCCVRALRTLHRTPARPSSTADLSPWYGSCRDRMQVKHLARENLRGQLDGRGKRPVGKGSQA